MDLLVITFVTVLAGSFALLVGVTSTAQVSKSTRLRIGAIQHSIRSHDSIGPFEMKDRSRRLCATQLNAVLERLRVRKHLETLLAHADSRMGAVGFAAVSAGGTAIVAVLVLLIVGSVLAAIPAGLAGAAAPVVWLWIRRRRRVGHFNSALPDAIDLFARALSGGHSVGSAIEIVGEQSPEPLSAEFMQVFQQQRLGLPFRDAWMQMSERMPSRDLYFLITAILVQKETGGDLTEILDRTAYVIRERVRIEGEVRTRTAQGRLTGWILSLLPVVMLALINLANPGYSDVLFHDPQGRKLLYLGSGLIVTGGLIIRKIVNVKV